MMRTDPLSPNVLGWDIGGVNTKAALVVDGEVRQVVSRAFEIQRAPHRLAALLREIADAVDARAPFAHAVTMTAELSQMFRTKREGVAFVLDAVSTAFPDDPVHVYTVGGPFIAAAEARRAPLRVAAANWSATAHVVAAHHRDALLVDVGSTTTDLIPIVGGGVAAIGLTDPARLASAELVYTGAVRTPVEAIVREVPAPEGCAAVSAEGFAIAGDVHVWRGDLASSDYEAPTPDGRPATPVFAGERLARTICADSDMLDDAAIAAIATAVADAQVAQIAQAIRRIRLRHPSLETAVVTGLGTFIGERAARAAGLQVIRLAAQLGTDGARSAPATAVALLLSERLASLAGGSEHAAPRPARSVTVVKLGGGLLADRAQWLAAVSAIAEAAAGHPLVVVPGGGPFADAVRDIDRRVGLSTGAAHWMAIAAMDQHAEMIVASLPTGSRVVDAAGIAQAHRGGQVPVLAPLQWLRAADPLPHSWDVTSDSIAAWLTHTLGARRLVLIKPAGASGPGIVDPYFGRAVPEPIEWAVSAAESLGATLASSTAPVREPWSHG
jgi:probable H4MPT-linked C1 transfer pathway protein